MRTAVVYKSIHHGNTRRVAEAMAAALGAELYTVEEAAEIDASRFDLVGLGSGIYFYRHHRDLRRLVANWPKAPARSFVFSTAGTSSLATWWHGSLVRLLRRRGSEVMGEFSCPGFDTFGPLWLIGGVHRGRPSEQDLARAAEFANGLLT
ncbi:MAG: flavodoxin domain-containing protein [Deltaproteobacteria bacterium]